LTKHEGYFKGSTNSIPVHQLLTRTNFFGPKLTAQHITKRSDYNVQTKKRKAHYKFEKKDLTYEGAYLNHSYDFPFLMLITQQAINASDSKFGLADSFQMDLEQISEIFGIKLIREQSLLPLKNSLAKLKSAKITQGDGDVFGFLKSSNFYAENFDYKNRCINIDLDSKFVEVMEVPRYITYIDISQLLLIKGGYEKILYRFLCSQSKTFIDFKLERLLTLTGLIDSAANMRKQKFILLNAFKSLKQQKFLKDYKFYDEYQSIRVLTMKFYEKETGPIDNYKSNFADIRLNKALKYNKKAPKST
jgi:hypothetical protein